MAATLYNFVYSIVTKNIFPLGNVVCHVLRNDEDQELTIFTDECISFFENNGYIRKINFSIKGGDLVSEFVLFFDKEKLQECAKKKGNLLFEISKEDMENIISTFFEMDVIKEPSE